MRAATRSSAAPPANQRANSLSATSRRRLQGNLGTSEQRGRVGRIGPHEPIEVESRRARLFRGDGRIGLVEVPAEDPPRRGLPAPLRASSFRRGAQTVVLPFQFEAASREPSALQATTGLKPPSVTGIGARRIRICRPSSTSRIWTSSIDAGEWTAVGAERQAKGLLIPMVLVQDSAGLRIPDPDPSGMLPRRDASPIRAEGKVCRRAPAWTIGSLNTSRPPATSQTLMSGKG